MKKNGLVLLDTSAWICFFQSKEGNPIQAMVQKLLIEQRAATTPPVILELIEGTQKPGFIKELLAELEALPSLPVTERTWQNAYKLGQQMRQLAKELIPMGDLIIATVAMEHNCALLHADRTFEDIAKRVPLSVQHLVEDTKAA